MSHPTYPHTGSGPSSYYQQPPPPPPPHVYGTHSPVPRPPNYYATYPGPPPPPPLHQQMSAHQQQYHQPGPSRGTPRGHYGSRGGHSYHHNYQQPHLQQQQQHPQQHQQHPQQHQHQHHHQHQHQHATHYPHTHVVNPALVPHHPHPQHPQHPQHSHTSQQMYTTQLAKYNQYTPTSYSYPSPTAPVFTPSWQTQQALGIEALPKQLSMGQQTYHEPSVTTGEDVLNVDDAVATTEDTPEPTELEPTELEPTEPTENLEPPTEEAHPTTTTTTFTTSSTSSPSHPQSPALSSPATPSPSTPSTSAAILTSAHIQTQPQPQTHSSSYLQMGSISTFEPSSPNLNAPTSSTNPETPQHPRNPPQWAIWSRRPHDPTHAPGIIISPRARPPMGVVLAALEGGTPSSSGRSSPRIGTRAVGGNKSLKEVDGGVDGGNVVGVPVGVKVGVVDEARIEAWVSQTNLSVSVSIPSSSAVTEMEAETPLVPGSPASSNTSVSVSAVVNNQAKEEKEKEKQMTEKAATIDTAEDAIPAPEASSTQTTTTPARSELGYGEGKSEERATTTTSGEMGAVAVVAPAAAPVAASSTPASTAPATTSTSTPASGATTPAPTATTTPAPPPPKKLWASLLRPSSSTSPSSAPGGAPQRNALPTSSIVGFSIPASALNRANNGNGNANANGASGVAVSGTKKSELVNLLTVGPAPPPNSAAAAVAGGLSAGAGAGAGGIGASNGTALRIRPRGLVNSGNMCFANSVLQVLVYCPPFHRLFVELGRLLVGPVVGNNKDSSEKNNKDNLEKNASSSATPLVDATVEFLREFVEDRRRKDRRLEVVSRNGGGVGGAKGAGKGKEREVVREEEEDWDGESFLPTYVYDAMKAKKRFDNMRGGHQEDAEEFFGFYLDTLEEELLSILHSVNPSPKPASNKGSGSVAMVEEKEEAAPPEDDGWLEVGKRNRMVVTRTIKATESPITRMFGGKFRSTLRASGQKDSVVVEDWRSLRLDIQRDQIHTIEDALSYISHPQPVQLTQSARPGVTIEAHQQVLIEALPPILVLHIKRFCYDTAVNGVVKVGKQVKFGPELVIGADVMVPAAKKAQPARYKLFGALYHHGLSASGGHYTLDVLHPNRYPNVHPGAKPREGWVRIDDDLVSDVRPEDVFGATEKDDSRCAYLLFYRRL